MLSNRFILTIFSFYFFYFLFYLGYGHVAGLGNLTSSLSARTRVYGNTRLRSLPVDLGSDGTGLTLETVYGHVAGWVRSHRRTQCNITGASLESFSRVLVGCHRYYEQDDMWHAWMNMARGQQCLQLPQSMFTSLRNRPSTVYLVCGRGKEIFTCKQPGSS